MAAQDYEQVTYNGPAGAQIGSSATEKIGLFGATPIAQPAVIAACTVAADGTSAGTQLNLVIVQLKLLGLIASS